MRRQGTDVRSLFWLLLPPALLIAGGLGLLLLGVLYDVTFAGIPYQDPPSELQARYLYHAEIASQLERTGGLVLLLGLLLVPIMWFLRRRRRAMQSRRPPPAS
jgi:hypothetical protein